MPVLYLALTVVSGELRLASERREEALHWESRRGIEAELRRMDFPALLEIASGATGLREEAVWTAFDRLRRESAACRVEPAIAAHAMKILADSSAIATPALANVAMSACPALRAPLREALVDGLALRAGASNDGRLVVDLIETDGALLREVEARVAFTGDSVRDAIRDLMVTRTADGYTRARRLLELGFEPSPTDPDPPLSETLREICAEDDEAWPEGARPEELALHRALVAYEQR